LQIAVTGNEERVMRKFGFGGAVMAAALFSGAAMAGPPPSLYTADQAAAGTPLFAQNCAVCHGADLKGGAGPALIGQSFASPGSDSTVGAIFTILAQQMPQSAPGSLTQAQYEDVMAYILQKNGYPAGSTAFAYKTGMSSTTALVSQVK
jgi:mono/diheme cytochrome c family protein